MMTHAAIARLRLQNQRIAGTEFAQPDAVVRWLGAVQAQEYTGAIWAVGQRMRGATAAALDQALADGTILRTHVMRPTWHFVTPADIRWLLALTAPRVKAATASTDRKLALDAAAIARSNAVLARAVAGGAQLTRSELAAALHHEGIATDTQRLTHIILHAELDGVLCSGARRGKQFTYALLDERVPPVAPLARDEALAELTRRYFTSHGPATAHDFVWWSGLTMADAKAGIAMVQSAFTHEVIDNRTYWFAPSPPITDEGAPIAYLLPNFDEFTVGYTDRAAALVAPLPETLAWQGNILFFHTVVIDGRVVGTWKRSFKKDAAYIDVSPFAPLGQPEAEALAVAAARYGRFVDLPVVLRIGPS